MENPKTSTQIKETFLAFWKGKDHVIIKNSSLLPENDPSALFTSAGMHPLVPYLTGTPHESGKKRLANIQRSLRTGDIEEVGKTRRHCTFFEMAGNWSLNDYFKKDAITWSFEFLTSQDWLGLNPKKLYVTVFKGDSDAPKDEESIQTWKEVFSTVGIGATVTDDPENSSEITYISCYPKSKNWWGPVSATGPCGPDTEIFYDTGKEHDSSFGKYCHPNCDCGKFIEIWNNVFMEFTKTSEGKYEKAKMQNVDTGLGIERVALLMQYMQDNGNLLPELTIFSTDLFLESAKIVAKNILNKEINQPLDIEIRNWKLTKTQEVSFKVIIEHIRAAVFVLNEKVEPSNKDRGYVLRRLLRRSIYNIMRLAQTKDSQIITSTMSELIDSICIQYSAQYPDLITNKDFIKEMALQETTKFLNTLKTGNDLLLNTKDQDVTEDFAFTLYQSYGFPFELTQELAAERNITLSQEVFENAKQKHQMISRQGMEKKFAGGLGDQSPVSIMYHTVTHLLHASLRKLLGSDVHQQGSNITPERLRFDINLNRKLSEDEITLIEKEVNTWISQELSVTREEMTAVEADKKNALAFFSEKYGSQVTVYTIGSYETPISRERCMGPHVSNTSEIKGTFKITKQEKIGANLLRLKAQLI